MGTIPQFVVTVLAIPLVEAFGGGAKGRAGRRRPGQDGPSGLSDGVANTLFPPAAGDGPAARAEHGTL